jgi:integrase
MIATAIPQRPVVPAAGERRISSVSAWGDPIWQLDIVRPGATKSDRTINWGFDLPDGTRFTDPASASLREATKTFLGSLRSDPPAGRRPLRDSTLVSTFNRMVVLIRWMMAEGCTCFADFDASAAESFLMTVRQRPGHGGGVLVDATIRRYIATLGHLHAQRDKIEDAVADDLGDYVAELTMRYRRSADRAEGSFPYTPDAVAIALALIGSAIRLIGRPADDVIALRSHAHTAYAHRLDPSISCDRASLRHGDRLARAALSGFSFTTIEGEASSWHRPPLFLQGVSTLIERIYDACFIVIAYLVGLRVSEILGLEANCIEFHHAGDGGERVAYLRGIIYKTAPSPEGKPHRWLAPEPVVRAIAVLEHLSTPARQKLGRPQLWLMTRDPVPLTLPIGIPASAAFTHRLNGPFAAFVGLPPHEGRPWHFSMHQGRKTFARFVGKRDRTGLHALQMHFGHVSRSMTDRAYVGTDFELGELIGTETLQETRAALEELLTAPNLAGAAGRMLAARSRFRGRTRDGEVSAYVDFILRDSGMMLGICDWGYCVYRREHSACQGDEAGPNPALRTQSVCVRCANFAVTERHRSIWQERRQRSRALLDHPGLDHESRRLAEQRIAEADQILAELDRGAGDVQ